MSKTVQEPQSEGSYPIQLKPQDQREVEHMSCESQITIENSGTINIFVCTPATQVSSPIIQSPCLPTLSLTGVCVPVTLSSKPKKDLQAKLRRLVRNSQVPSALAGAVFCMARRFQSGYSPANELESKAFAVFRNLSPAVRNVMACSVKLVDALPLSVQKRLFASELIGGGDQPLALDMLTKLVSRELLQRTSLITYGNTECLLGERPGLPRPTYGPDTNAAYYIPVICCINGLRTNTYVPPFKEGIRLTLAEYKPEELQHICSIDANDQLDCQVQTKDCPGNNVEGACLRVQEVQAGEAVILKGINFFNTQAKVRLTGPFGTSREVDAHVCGDVTTPLNETIDGIKRTILDCRVQDVITFKVPEDLPDAIYRICVVVPNNTGVDDTTEFLSDEQFIRVVPPATTSFQIASVRLDAVDETDPDWWGSDEVALNFFITPLKLDLTPGEIIHTPEMRFDDVDSGDSYSIDRVLFHGSNISGVALSIVGFEIDDEDAYKKQIKEYSDALVEIMKTTWQAIATGIGGIGGGLTALALGLSAGWAGAIGAAITFVVDLILAAWAPADLIMEDFAGLTALDLGMLTNMLYPPPPVVQYTSEGGIKVKVEPVQKHIKAVQYFEKRSYHSDDEGSQYNITLRYNRL